MKKFLVLLFSVFLFMGQAYATTVNTNLWTVEKSPNGSTGSVWTSVGGNQATQSANLYGSMISDFTYTGDFTFSGSMTPTYPTGGFDDNDILGIVFGWTNDLNHYRLGWNAGGVPDAATSLDGLFLIKEVAGVSTTLYTAPSVFWTDDTSYAFTAGRNGDNISFSLGGESFSVADTSFMNGHIGFYVESQTATFSGLASVPEPPTVPEPATMLLFGLGLLGLAGVNRKKQ